MLSIERKEKKGDSREGEGRRGAAVRASMARRIPEIRREEERDWPRQQRDGGARFAGSWAKERDLLKNKAVLFATAIDVRGTLGYERCRVDL